MSEFELKLDGTTYKCSSNNFEGINQNWNIQSKTNDVSVTMSIPISSKVSRSQCMLFVEIFHEALMEAKKKQKEDLRFPQQLS